MPDQITAGLIMDFLAVDENRQMVAEVLWPALFDQQRPQMLSETKDNSKTRWLLNGADITSNQAGTQVAARGESYADRVNIVGGSAYWSNKPESRQLNLSLGAGADCLFDILVSSCFSSLTGFTEGQTFTSLSGCTFKGYSTIQGAITYAAGGYGREVRIAVCAGTYTEDIIVPASAQTDGITVDAVTYGRNYVDFMSWPVTIQASTTYAVDMPSSTNASTHITFKGIKFLATGGNRSIRWGSSTLTPPNLRLVECGVSGITARSALADLTLTNCKFITYGIDSTAAAAGQTVVWEMENVEFANLPLDLTFPIGSYYGVLQTYTESVLRMRNCRNVKALNVLGATYVDLDNVYFRYDNTRAYTAQFVQDANSQPGTNRINLHGCLFSGMDTAQAHVDVLKFNYTGADSVGKACNTFVNITKCEFLFPRSSGGTFHYISFNKAATTSAGGTFLYRDTLILSNTFNGVDDIGGSTGVLSAAVVTENGGVLASPLIVDNVPTTATITVTTTGSPVIGNAAATEPFVTIGNTAGLSAERALTAGTGITITDAGANSTVTVAAQAAAATFVLGDATVTAGLANYEVLTQGNGIGVTQNSGTHLATVALGNLTGNWSPTGAFNITTLGTQSGTAQIASGLTGATSGSRYVGGTTSGAPVTGSFNVGDFVIAQNAHIWVCTVAGSPGTWVDVSASSTANTSHELIWFSQTPVTGDNLAYIPIQFNGFGATAVTPLRVRAKDYGYGTTTINLLRAPNGSTVAAAGGLPNPSFTTILTSDLNIESSHITMTGLEDVTITGGALSSTTLALDDILRVNYDSVNNMVNAAIELTVTV